MPAYLRVAGGVAVERVVATQRHAALLARPQMDPVRAYLHALVALMAFFVFDGLDGAEVSAASVGCHGFSLIVIVARVHTELSMRVLVSG